MKYFLLSLIILCACHKQKANSDDFDHLMGFGQKCWENIQTVEDKSRMDFFRKIYEEKRVSNEEPSKPIPKVVHFIWVGPKAFPKESVANVESWVAKHPDWQFKFWTDRQRPLPSSKMELVLIKESDLKELYPYFLDSTNYAEKSDLLRYKILQEEGGVYVDHDVACFQSIDSLVTSYEFFCGLEPPHSPIGASSISVCNNIIASTAHHPILDSAIEKSKERWERLKKMYPGEDKESVMYRVFYRTFSAFEEAAMQNIGHKSMIFPAGYFNNLGKTRGLFSNHTYDGTWYQTEDPFEKLLRERLMKMAKKMNKILLMSVVSIMMNVGLAIFIFRRKRHAA
jgi:hypothetical protein